MGAVSALAAGLRDRLHVSSVDFGLPAIVRSLRMLGYIQPVRRMVVIVRPTEGPVEEEVEAVDPEDGEQQHNRHPDGDRVLSHCSQVRDFPASSEIDILRARNQAVLRRSRVATGKAVPSLAAALFRYMALSAQSRSCSMVSGAAYAASPIDALTSTRI